jgi:nitrogen regulatory protein P-II 2
MNTTERQMITVVAEAVLERKLTALMTDLGARGYSISHAHGRGTRGVHTEDWEGPNVRIESVVTAAVADRILTHLVEHYFPHYAIVAFTTEVRVARPDKFG